MTGRRWFAVVAGVSVVAAIAWSYAAVYAAGEQSGVSNCEAKQAKTTAEAQTKADQKVKGSVKRAADTSTQREANRAALDTVFNQLEMEQRNAPPDPIDACVLPAERLRAWANANAARADNDTATGQLDDRAAAIAATGLGTSAGLRGQPPASGAPVPPAGGAALRSDGFFGSTP